MSLRKDCLQSMHLEQHSIAWLAKHYSLLLHIFVPTSLSRSFPLLTSSSSLEFAILTLPLVS